MNKRRIKLCKIYNNFEGGQLKMIMDKFYLKDKVAIVTGGTKGIGRAIALGLAEAGADVVAVSRSEENVNTVTEEIKALGRQSIALPVDVSDKDSIDRMIAEVEKKFGKLDILINNAGINTELCPFEKVSLDNWNKTIAVNLTGAFLCSQSAGKLMKKSGGGNIVNVSSILGQVNMAWSTPYSVTKAGMISLTKGLAVEWAAKNIRVNGIAPAFIETDMTEGLLKIDYVKNYILKKSVFGRLANLDEIVGAVIFLASDASSYITGETINIDSGWLVQ